jgi:hypothetical protein
MNRLRPALLAALLVTGCIPNTAKLDPYRSAEAFCPVYVDLVASAFTNCFGFAPYLESTTYGNLGSLCDTIAAGEKAGRIGFDRNKAEALVATIRSSDCNALDLPDSAIPFIPLVGPSGVCLSGIECTPASKGCFNPSLTCPGHCLPPTTTPGVACGGLNPPCGDAFYCSTSGGISTCQSALGTGGTGCSTGSPPCKASDYCDNVAVPSTCKPMGGVGSACTSDTQCDYQNDIYCNTTSGKCYAANTSATAGQSCAYPNRCGSGLWCDATSTCQSPLPLGAACTGDSACGSNGNGCVADSTAAGSLSHCRIRLVEGASCIVGVMGCQFGLYCNGSALGATGSCLRSPKIGQPCGTILGERASCLDGWCDRPGTPQPLQGTCAAPRPPGQPCPSGNECGNEVSNFEQNSCIDVTGTGVGTGNQCVARCSAVAAGASGIAR